MSAVSPPFSDALLIIDGYNLIFRSYFAFMHNPLRNDRGENTSAIFGFFRTIAALMREYTPSEMCVALDPIGATFRHKLYPQYKGTRDRTPDDLKVQFPRIEAIMEKMHIPCIRIDDYEADDVISSVARVYAERGRTCLVVSSDKDLMQLVNKHVLILKPQIRKQGFELLDEQGVQESKGVRPDQIVDYLALLGDTSDNIPGVSGIGVKTACQLLREYGSLAHTYEMLDQMKSSRQKDCLLNGRDSAQLSKKLITLVDTIEVAIPNEGYPIALTPQNAAALFRAENIHSIFAEYKQLASGGHHTEDLNGDLNGTLNLEDPNEESKTVAKYADRYQLIKTVDEIKDWVQRIREHGICAFDTETTSLDPMRAEPVGLSFAISDHRACYIPLRGPDGVALEDDAVRAIVKPVLEDSAVQIVGQNIKYDIKVMANWGVHLRGVKHDTMIAAWLIDVTAHSYKLDVLAQKYLNYHTVPYPAIAKKSDFSAVSLSDACIYAAEDADVTYALYCYFDKKLQKDPVLHKLYYEIEMTLIPILVEMEIAGIKLDTNQLKELEAQFNIELDALRSEVYRLSGEEFNINSTKALQKILFEKLKLTPIKKTKTGYSTDTSVLTLLANAHPLPSKILEYRILSKLLSTYVVALPQLVNPRSGRIHTTFSIIGTNTGRISSSDPNLQNIPIKDAQGKKIRECFVAKEGCVFVSADYSQIELVVFTHLSQDPALLLALREEQDIHLLTAATIFGVNAEEIDARQRRVAKAINFGVMYGMSAFRLSRELNISLAEAQRFIDQYFEKYAGVKRYIEQAISNASKTGYVSTLLGRKRTVPDINNENKIVRQATERVVINTPIQGSAADIMKLAMQNISRVFSECQLKSRMILQVHDELVVEALESEEQEVIEILTQEMSAAYELSVPLRVNIDSGKTWGGLK